MQQSLFNSLTMTVCYCHTSCPAFTYQWCVRRRDLRLSSAATLCKEQRTNFHIHQCANPEIQELLSVFYLFFLKKYKHKFSINNQKNDHIWLATVISHPDSILSWLGWGVMQIWFGPTETWSDEGSVSVWCSAGRPSKFLRWPSSLLQTARASDRVCKRFSIQRHVPLSLLHLDMLFEVFSSGHKAFNLVKDKKFQ